MITRLTPKVLNSDSDETLLKPNEMMDAINIQLSGKQEADSGIVKHTMSNAVVSLSESITQYSDGKNTVIGTVSDENLGVIFFFVHNDAGNHGIYAYSTKTKTHRLIFKGSILNFEENGFVKGDLIRIKRKPQDEELSLVTPSDDDPGGDDNTPITDGGDEDLFEEEQIDTVAQFFYYERDFSLLAETARISVPAGQNNETESIWSGDSVPIAIRVELEISNDNIPHLGAFYPEAGDIESELNIQAFNNPSSFNAAAFDLTNTLNDTSDISEIQSQFDDYANIDSSLRSWIRNGAFQVNLHPDAVNDPFTSIKVTLRVLNTDTFDVDKAAIVSLSSPISVWPSNREAPTNVFTYGADDLTSQLLGDTSDITTLAFGHDTDSNSVIVTSAYYSTSAASIVGGSIIPDLLSGLSYDNDEGGAYHDFSSLVYSNSSGSNTMGERSVMCKIKIDYSQTEDWIEYKSSWQQLFDFLNQSDDVSDDLNREGERDETCDGYEQPTCDGWSGDTSITDPYQAALAAWQRVQELNLEYDCNITFINPFPCPNGASIDIAEFKPGFFVRNGNGISTLAPPISSIGAPDLNAALNGEIELVNPETYATGVFEFLIPVQVSGPGYLYKENIGLAIINRDEWSGLNTNSLGFGQAESLENNPGEMSLSIDSQRFHDMDTSGEIIQDFPGGIPITYSPRIIRARTVSKAGNNSNSIAKAVYDNLTSSVSPTFIQNWTNGIVTLISGSGYESFTQEVFDINGNGVLDISQELEGHPSTWPEQINAGLCYGSLFSCNNIKRIAASEIAQDADSVVSETSTKEPRDSSITSVDGDTTSNRESTPQDSGFTTASQAAKTSQTKQTKGY
tara:strand:- start:11793 stop:14342 length:2550 start_codon:yes stop_codon:yes gene_type:complete